MLTREEKEDISIEDNIYNAKEKLKSKRLDESERIEQELIIKGMQLLKERKSPRYIEEPSGQIKVVFEDA